MPSASSLSAVLRPSTDAQAADALAAAAEAGRSVRIVGGATRSWGRPIETDLELCATGLSGVREHNAGDLTAVIAAGTPLAEAQALFAGAGQMLAVDPPADPAATVGGLVASGDSGPLRHRHGAVRDLILGATVALPDATLARAGSRVIKNVAGYDLPKLYCGSFGTLGLIVEVVMRLHPIPVDRVTAVGTSADPDVLVRAAARIARAPLELMCLDVAWQDGRGAVLARAGGSAAAGSARAAADLLRGEGAHVDLPVDDEALWHDQRAAQRAREDGVVVRVSGRAAQLPAVLEAVRDQGGRLVGRAALGLFWVGLAPGDVADVAAAVERLRTTLSPSPCVVLDAPRALREALDPWGVGEGPELSLARRLKARFDPTATCNPGLFVGGI